MIQRRPQSSSSTDVVASSLSNERPPKEFVIIDLTDLVRRFINTIDYEVTDLGYNLEGIIGMYDSTQWGTSEIPGQLAKFAEHLCNRGYIKGFEDALVVADYTINTFYPAIKRQVAFLGYVGAKAVGGKVRLTGGNRQLHCNVMMMVV